MFDPPEEGVDVPDEPHDDGPEEGAQLDDVPDEDGDAVESVGQREDLALERHRNYVAVTYLKKKVQIKKSQQCALSS